MLPAQPDFARLFHQVRTHDQTAFADLMRLFAPEVCPDLTARLRRCPLGRLIDADDIWQEVQWHFYRRAGEADLDLSNPDQLLHLLRTMARNELRDQARWARRARRDQSRECDGGNAIKSLADPHPTPSQSVEIRDLLDHAMHHLRQHERDLILGWAEGKGWEELARGNSDTPEAVRKRFERAMSRLTRHCATDDNTGRTEVMPRQTCALALG